MEWLDDKPLLSKAEWIEIGNNIRKYRKSHKWTQDELAGYMRTDYRVVSRHEQGGHMDLETILKYSVVFGCSANELLPLSFRGGIETNLAGILPSLYDTISVVSKLPFEKQIFIADIISKLLQQVA